MFRRITDDLDDAIGSMNNIFIYDVNNNCILCVIGNILPTSCISDILIRRDDSNNIILLCPPQLINQDCTNRLARSRTMQGKMKRLNFKC